MGFESFSDNIGNLGDKKEGEIEKEQTSRRQFLAHALSAFLTLSVTPLIKAEEPTTPEVRQEESNLEKLLEKRQKIVESLHKVVESEKIVEKIKKIKERFGGAVKNFLSIHQIEQDISVLNRINLEDDKDLVDFFEHNGRNILIQTRGSILEQAYEERWSLKEINLNDIKTEGIEMIGISEEEFIKEIERRYGKNYFNSAVSGVKYIPEVLMQGDLATLGYVEALGWSRLFKAKTDDLRTEIVIHKPPQGITKESFWEVLDHEVHHANDWNNSPALTSADRIIFLSEVSERIHQPDAFLTSYSKFYREMTPEALGEYLKNTKVSLLEETTPEQILDYILVSEYWAEIGKEYIKDQEGFLEKSPEDAKLVKKWMEKIENNSVKVN